MKNINNYLRINIKLLIIIFSLVFASTVNSQQCQLVKACKQSAVEKIDVLFSVNNKVCFTITDTSRKSLLYCVDNDSNLTSYPTDGNFVGLFCSLPDKVYFTVKENNYKSIWITNGSNYSKKLYKFRDYGGQNDTVGLFLIGSIANKTYFIVHRFTDSIWVTDGTPEGTKNTGIGLNTFGQYFNSLRLVDQIDNRILFIYHNTSNQNLIISDGTVTGTMTIHSFPISFSAPDILKCGGNYYTKIKTDDFGEEMYKIDIDNAKVILLKDIVTGSKSSNISHYFNIHDTLFFTQGNAVRKLWKSDGTTEGTQFVTNIPQVEVLNLKNQFIPLKDKYFFVGDDDTHLSELWITDGTQNGTKMVADINKSGSASPIEPFVLNNFLFFSADDGIHGRQLWLTDGTEIGTKMVKDLKGSLGSFPENLYGYKDLLFFTINNGKLLYRTDGTEEGTIKLMDYYSSSLSNISFPDFKQFKNHVYIRNKWIWISDGTQERTKKIYSPYDDYEYELVKMVSTDNNLFFHVSYGTSFPYNHEIWKLDLSTSVKSENVNNLIIFPNPVNANAKLQFHLDRMESVSLDIYDLLGNKLFTVINNKELDAGNHEFNLNTNEFSNGIYFIKLQLSSGKIKFIKFIK